MHYINNITSPSLLQQKDVIPAQLSQVVCHGGPHDAPPTDHHFGLAGQGGLAVPTERPAVAGDPMKGPSLALQQPGQHSRGHAPTAPHTGTHGPAGTRHTFSQCYAL